jgi:hypothetical protein
MEDIRTIQDDDEPQYQGTWEEIRPEPQKVAGRKDGKSAHDFIDSAAFGRLLKRIEAKRRPPDEERRERADLLARRIRNALRSLEPIADCLSNEGIDDLGKASELIREAESTIFHSLGREQ